MSVRGGDEAVPEVTEATHEEGATILDAAARRHLGMTGEEFLAAWRSDDLGEVRRRPMFDHVAMLVPFAR